MRQHTHTHAHALHVMAKQSSLSVRYVLHTEFQENENLFVRKWRVVVTRPLQFVLRARIIDCEIKKRKKWENNRAN